MQSQKMEFGYAELETVLARAFGIGPDGMGRLNGRIKHLRKLGLLASTPGRGNKIRYTRADVSLFHLALTLSEFGVDPTVVATFVETHRKKLQDWLKDQRDPFVLFFQPSLVTGKAPRRIRATAARDMLDLEASNPPGWVESFKTRYATIDLVHLRRRLDAALAA